MAMPQDTTTLTPRSNGDMGKAAPRSARDLLRDLGYTTVSL